MGTGTTSTAAANCGRNSVGTEIDSEYFDMACHRVRDETMNMFTDIQINVSRSGVNSDG